MNDKLKIRKGVFSEHRDVILDFLNELVKKKRKLVLISEDKDLLYSLKKEYNGVLYVKKEFLKVLQELEIEGE